MSNPYEEVLQTDDQVSVPSKRRRIVECSDKSGGKTAEFSTTREIPEITAVSAECKEETSKRSTFDLNIPDTICTLRKHMLNIKKSTKALKLFKDLMSSQMTTANSVYFAQAMDDFFSWTGADMTNVDMLNSTADLVSLAEERLDMFTREQVFKVRTWALMSCVAKDLGSDDSFVFSRACNSTVTCFEDEALFPPSVRPEDKPPAPHTLRDISIACGGSGSVKEEQDIPCVLKRQRIAAVLTCMRLSFRPYKRAAWAKQPVEKLFTTVSHKRLRVDEDQRNELDDLVSALTATCRKLTSGGTQQKIRTYDSTAHPLTTKNVGMLR